MDKEKELARQREKSRRYYAAHREELSEKRKAARRAKLDAMNEEELASMRKKQAEYMRTYRKRNPEKRAVIEARYWLNKIQRQEADTHD